MRLPATPALAVALTALTAGFAQPERATLSYGFHAGETLVYELKERRTDRIGSSADTTMAQSTLEIAAGENPSEAPVLLIQKHRVAGNVTPLEGLKAPLNFFRLPEEGISSLLAAYFPPLPHRPLVAGDSWDAPFVPPSLGRIKVTGDPPRARYSLLRLDRSGPGMIAHLAATADLNLTDAVFSVSELGLRRATSTAVRIDPGTPAYQAGIRTGDRIIKVRGRPVATWEEAASVQSTGRLAVEIHPPLRETDAGKVVKRDSHYVFRIPEGFGIESAGIFSLDIPVSDAQEVIVGGTEEDSPADKAGISPGDTIVRLGAVEVESWGELEQLLSAVPPGTRIEVQRVPLGERNPVPTYVITRARELYRFSARGAFSGDLRIDVASGTLIEASWACHDLVVIPTFGDRSSEITTVIENTLSLVERRPTR